MLGFDHYLLVATVCNRPIGATELCKFAALNRTVKATMMHTQLGGNGAGTQFFDMIIPQNLRFEFRVDTFSLNCAVYLLQTIAVFCSFLVFIVDLGFRDYSINRVSAKLGQDHS